MRKQPKRAARRRDTKDRTSKAQPFRRVARATLANDFAASSTMQCDDSPAPAPTRAVSPQERHDAIARAAYAYSQSGAFSESSAVDHWLRAERDFDAANAA